MTDSTMVERLALVFAQHADHFFDNDGPSNASWDEFSPREQLVATAAARAAIEAMMEPNDKAARALEWQSGFDAGVEQASPEWQDISTAPREDTIMLGKWYEDDCDGYHGESRWLWIASGNLLGNGDGWCDIMDGEFATYSYRAPSHWRPLDAPLVVNRPTPSKEPQT